MPIVKSNEQYDEGMMIDERRDVGDGSEVKSGQDVLIWLSLTSMETTPGWGRRGQQPQRVRFQVGCPRVGVAHSNFIASGVTCARNNACFAFSW